MPAGTGQREQTIAFEEADHVGELELPAQEGSGGNGKIRAVEALQRREVAGSQLVDALGSCEIRKAVLAEIRELQLDELSRGGRDEHLATVTGRGDACSSVDIASDVALVGQQRRPCVQTNPHFDRAGRELLGHVARGLECSRCRRKGDEERVSLSVDLNSIVAGARLADYAAMLCERLRVLLRPELVQELRRALHVGEEESDGSRGEITPHKRHHAPKQGLRHGGRRVIGLRESVQSLVRESVTA